jgi:hypothetical protein
MTCRSDIPKYCCYCAADGEEKAWMAVYEGITCHCFEPCHRERPEYFVFRDGERAYAAFAMAMPEEFYMGNALRGF